MERRRERLERKAYPRYLIELGAQNGASGSLEQSERDLGTWAENGVDWKTRGAGGKEQQPSCV